MEKQTFLAIALIVFGILFGLVQEMIKVNINSYIHVGDSNSEYYQLDREGRLALIHERTALKAYDYFYSHTKLDVLSNLDRRELVTLKWVLTPIFIGINFLFCYAIVYLLSSSNHSHLKMLMYVYVLGVLFSMAVFGLGKLVNQDFYPFARKVIGFLQSLIPVVIIYMYSLIPRNEFNAK